MLSGVEQVSCSPDEPDELCDQIENNYTYAKLAAVQPDIHEAQGWRNWFAQVASLENKREVCGLLCPFITRARVFESGLV